MKLQKTITLPAVMFGLYLLLFALAWGRVGYVAARINLAMATSYAIPPTVARDMVNEGIRAGLFAGSTTVAGVMILLYAGIYLLSRNKKDSGEVTKI